MLFGLLSQEYRMTLVIWHWNRLAPGHDSLQKSCGIVGVVLHATGLVLDGRAPGIPVIEGKNLEMFSGILTNFD